MLYLLQFNFKENNRVDICQFIAAYLFPLLSYFDLIINLILIRIYK